MKRSIEDTPVVCIGAGAVASALAVGLYRRGFRIVQVYSRTEVAARTLAAQVEATHTTDVAELSTEGALYIVALTDAACATLLPQIAARCATHGLLVHTAGNLPMSLWQGQATRYGVLYPLQTFSKGREVDFDRVSFFIEAAQPADEELLRAVAGTLSARVYRADSHQRKHLHLAAVFACNFSNHMYALADALLQKHGLPFDALLPLIEETARKVHTFSPRAAQTGPAVRNDGNVMQAHLALLEQEPALQTIYEQLSKSIYEYHQL